MINDVKTSKKIFDRRKMKWVYIMGIVIIIGGVMAFGFVGHYVYDIEDYDYLPMVYMILPLVIVYAVAIRGALGGMEERMRRLTDGIQAVTEGNLDYRIEMKDAEEYYNVYEGFNRMAAELSQTRREMQDFTNTFAHEFKTPITSINGFAELLRDNWETIDDNDREQYLSLIAEQSLRLSKLSQNTLLLSKVNAMQIITDREDYDLSEQLRSCVILLMHDIDKKNLEIDFPEDSSIMFHGNRELMEHVWINIISNAIKYTPVAGMISIGQFEDDDTITVTVRDTGVGMDSDVASHIFEKYYRYDTAVSSSGNGIGLSVAARIVSLCGGDITVDSAPGKGSIFTIKLKKSPK